MRHSSLASRLQRHVCNSSVMEHDGLQQYSVLNPTHKITNAVPCVIRFERIEAVQQLLGPSQLQDRELPTAMITTTTTTTTAKQRIERRRNDSQW